MKLFPTNYSLSFEPDLAKFTFLGEETINFTVTEKTEKFSLDCVDLKISSCKLLKNNKEISSSWKLNQKSQKLTIVAQEKLRPGNFKLKISFRGILNDKLAGFYRSKYEINGKEKYIATTQFEAADARRAFPCFDEPAFKATFDITLVADKNLTTVSNTFPKTEKILSNGKKSVTFATTPKMSTYLVYLGVGELECVQKKHRKILIRCFTTPGKKEGGKFALEVAARCLDYYQNYFAHAYPLSKLDLLAIPDFSVGAMENWGAITFRENRLLFYPGKSSQSTMQSVAEVIAHEITHQWFGNLVTMKWWDDLWLNESFATFMAYKMIEKYYPKWDYFTQYIEARTFSGMALDSLISSHPISVKVDNVNKIDELFDAIAYSKGGSVLRMLEGYLGETAFRNGLRKYIARFKYQNAAASDLWHSLEKISDKPIAKLTKKFVLQTGYPLVSVSQSQGSIQLSQNRFLLLKSSADKSLWDIPLVVQTDKRKFVRYLFTKKNDSATSLGRYQFLNLNTNYTGFYLSQYDKALLTKLGENLDKINLKDRVGLIHDFFALVVAEKERLETFLEFVGKYFLKEKDSFVLAYLIGKFVGIRLSLESANSKVDSLIELFSNHAISSVGFSPVKSELPQVANLRGVALSALALLENKQVLKFAQEKLSGKTPIHPDIASAIYKTAIRSNPKNYNKILTLYRKAQAQEEKVRLLGALAGAKDQRLLKKTLELTLSSEVRYSNTIYTARSLATNPQGRKIGINWLINKWKDLTQKKGSNTMVSRYLLQSLVPSTPKELENKVEKFFAKNTPSNLKKTVKEVLEEMRANVRFSQKYS